MTVKDKIILKATELVKGFYSTFNILTGGFKPGSLKVARIHIPCPDGVKSITIPENRTFKKILLNELSQDPETIKHLDLLRRFIYFRQKDNNGHMVAVEYDYNGRIETIYGHFTHDDINKIIGSRNHPIGLINDSSISNFVTYVRFEIHESARIYADVSLAKVTIETFVNIMDKVRRIQKEVKKEQIVVELTKNPGYKEPMPKNKETRAPLTKTTGIVQPENQYKIDTIRDIYDNVSLGKNSGATSQRDEIPKSHLKRIRVPSHSRLPTARTHKSKSSTSSNSEACTTKSSKSRTAKSRSHSDGTTRSKASTTSNSNMPKDKNLGQPHDIGDLP
jgi:hypothetical protein